MTKKEMINEIALIIESENIKSKTSIGLPLVVEDLDIWVNNSDDDNGEYFKVYGIGQNEDDEFGVFVGEDDFFSFDELTQEEVERIFELL